MKMIGFYIGTMEGGGAERVVLNLLNEFYERKVPVVLILRFKKGVYLNQLNLNIKVIEINANNPLLIVFRIWKVCKVNNVTTLFSIARYNNVLALIASHFLSLRIVIREATTFNGFFDKKKLLEKAKGFFLLLLVKLLYPKADRIIANSIDTARDILLHVGVRKNKVIVIGNPLVNGRIKSLSLIPVDDSQILNLTRPIIISVGRLVYQKNFDQLIRSFAILKKSVSDANLLLLGEGILKDQLVELTKELNVSDCVHFLGFVENPYKYLRFSDVFVLSSLFEGFGNVLVEALSLGLPIVSTDCSGGPHEILDNGKYGMLVPVNDEIAMAEAIIETLKSKVDSELLIRRSDYYSVEEIADEYLKVLL